MSGGVGAVLHEDRPQLRQRLQAGVASWALVDLDHRVALLALDGDRDDLLGQPALVGRLQRALVGAQRPAVHVGPGHLQLGGVLRGLLGHALARAGVGQTAADHRVDRLAVADAYDEASHRSKRRYRARCRWRCVPPPIPRCRRVPTRSAWASWRARGSRTTSRGQSWRRWSSRARRSPPRAGWRWSTPRACTGCWWA